MKKTFNLSIGGSLFFVEEDAYEKLDSYMNSIRTYFENNPDKDEILRDIEGRIAEKFAENDGKVVTMQDVVGVISVMGTVEQFSDVDTAAGQSETSASKKAPKKLYRDMDTAIIAGVSGGLGHFFGIDPIIFRVIFLISIFFGGAGVIAYGILWIIVPAAKTPSQKISMRGDVVTLSAMAEMIKEKMQEVNTDKHRNAFVKIVSIPFDLLRQLLKLVQNVLFPSIRLIIGTVILIGSFLLGVGATVLLSMSLFAVSQEFVNGPLLALAQGTIAHILAVALYLTALIPLIFTAIVGVNLISRRNPVSKIAAFSLLGIWFISIAVATGTGSRIAMQATNILRNDPYYKTQTEVVPVSAFTNLIIKDNQSVRLIRGDSYKVEIQGSVENLHDVTFINGTSTLIVSGKDRRDGTCIICGNKYVDVQITVPTLSMVTLENSSDVSGELTATNLQLNVSGASSANLNMNAKTAVIMLKDSSDISLIGKATVATLDISNSSSYQGANFLVNTVIADISNSSYASLYAIEKLNITATNNSTVSYSGTPSLEKQIDNSSHLTSRDVVQ